MKYFSCLITLMAVFLLLAPHPASCLDINGTLQQTDPTSNTVGNEVQPLLIDQRPLATDTSTGTTSGIQDRWQQIMERLTKIFERLVDIFEKLFGKDAKAEKAKADKAKSDKAKADKAKADKEKADKAKGGDASGIAAKIGEVAHTFPTKYGSAGKFPYAPGTENGNLGCANVASTCLKAAGVKIGIILNVQGVKNALLALKSPNDWKKAKAPPFLPGDVVIWSPPAGSIHGHIGVCCKNGNSVMAMNNSSSRRKPIFSPPAYRKIECVLRKA